MSMKKIVVADSMEEEVLKELMKLGSISYKPANLASELKDADVLIVRSATNVTKELLIHATKLKIVARAGVGLDNVDVTTCKDRGIKVINTPAASSNAVAELVIGLLFSLHRHIYKAHFQMKNGKWEKSKLVGEEIAGKKLGIIGFGRIGSLVAEKATVFGMAILAYDPTPRSDAPVKFVDLDTLLREADVITIHVALTKETKDFINQESIEKMKNGVYIINTSRGEVIEESALYDACKSGKVKAAALDVFKKEPYDGKLLQLENVCFTPHIGASTKEAQLRIGKELVEKLKEILAH